MMKEYLFNVEADIDGVPYIECVHAVSHEQAEKRALASFKKVLHEIKCIHITHSTQYPSRYS
jgi:hypothetical protein